MHYHLKHASRLFVVINCRIEANHHQLVHKMLQYHDVYLARRGVGINGMFNRYFSLHTTFHDEKLLFSSASETE